MQMNRLRRSIETKLIEQYPIVWLTRSHYYFLFGFVGYTLLCFCLASFSPNPLQNVLRYGGITYLPFLIVLGGALILVISWFIISGRIRTPIFGYGNNWRFIMLQVFNLMAFIPGWFTYDYVMSVRIYEESVRVQFDKDEFLFDEYRNGHSLKYWEEQIPGITDKTFQWMRFTCFELVNDLPAKPSKEEIIEMFRRDTATQDCFVEGMGRVFDERLEKYGWESFINYSFPEEDSMEMSKISLKMNAYYSDPYSDRSSEFKYRVATVSRIATGKSDVLNRQLQMAILLALILGSLQVCIHYLGWKNVALSLLAILAVTLAAYYLTQLLREEVTRRDADESALEFLAVIWIFCLVLGTIYSLSRKKARNSIGLSVLILFVTIPGFVYVFPEFWSLLNLGSPRPLREFVADYGGLINLGLFPLTALVAAKGLVKEQVLPRRD